ncbi:NADH dehydrogenase [ubiquinone] 1 alpha subcomplex subunit 2-like [Dreissena polymorpha]|uniref:NADH dehydrogenase [ubiquinone] 1 alpha subcomplex subunit 2 n=1 Tax=Dreissena polymorpha TaxID=45954 RepID=A0A9D4EJY2_DREPO|nr:NADH dehydrogenase [ubiquinone] 1 alpha subcomplex subunit 2-like [Dreissena polymorpha]KAH3781677.1 hypothetical protein DPMN_159578 [Dreissena polymorpha]
MAAAVKFSKHLKELRIHLCQKSAASQGVREFIETQYVALKKSNPKFPILIRECSSVQPSVTARYEHGKEARVPLQGKSSAEVLSTIQSLNKS